MWAFCVSCNETGSYLNFCLNWFSDISLAGEGKGAASILTGGGRHPDSPLGLRWHPRPGAPHYCWAGVGICTLPSTPNRCHGLHRHGQWKVGLVSLGSGEGPDPPLASSEHPGGKGRGAQVQVLCVFSTDPVGRRQGAYECLWHEENASPSSQLGLLWHHLRHRKEEGRLMTAWQGWTPRLPSQPLLAGQDFPAGFGWSREVIV